ncbi:P pilus assembly protein chaperone PapD-like protein [Advenella kashmirensis WT001]|uniref:P pilus assembly protein chaperone PapD-like protein n=2 Tax=Advenella kashmirensis TaxID=310575 RepID=I3UA47_ADVKW|nr:P pilus assembly protein chaperone PapD-like protein [Advenella kashmirensis WT001]
MRSLLRYIVLAILLAGGQPAIGAGLQVTPIVLDIKQSQKSDGLWLTNTSNASMDVQVRVFEWVQNNETDVLTPTTDFVASPPMAKIPGSGKQFVRLVKVGQPAVAMERSYRIVVDELPLESAASKGLTFALRYSIPVFIQGVNKPTPPNLNWNLAAGPKGSVLLSIHNSGTTRAKLSDLQFTSNRGGKTHLVNKGLFGYALANSGRHWSLKNSQLFSAGGTFKVVMNGKTLQIPVSAPN